MQSTSIQRHIAATGRLARLETLFVLIVVLRLFLAWVVPMTDTTEARYADMARMMVETGDWITPQFDYGVPFWGKPPLHTWLSAAGIAVLEPVLAFIGVDAPRDLAARLPILGASLVLLAVLHAWIGRVRDSETAWIATVILASSGLFFGASAFVMTDMPLALGVVMAMAGFHLGIGSRGRAPDRRWAFVGFAGLAVGLLAKGPIVLPLVGLPVGLWLLVGGRWSLLRRLPWGRGLLLVAVIALPWYVAAEIKTPGFLRYFIVGEHFERFVVPGWEGDLYGSGHERPKGIVWLYALGTFLPWTLFALVPAARMGRLRRSGPNDGLYGYLVAFAVAPMIVFTPAANVLAAYVLPGLPAAAALLAVAWRDARLPEGRVVEATFAMAALAVPVAITVLFLSGNERTWPLRTAYGAVRQLEEMKPGTRLWTLGDRIFSVEYYAEGRATHLDPTSLPELLGDGTRDAVVVRDRSGSQAVPEGFEDLGRWTDYRLWLEREDG
jgi:4-amino-4-deoxy-L-arabinose transferase-like glycosyltransferase